VLFRGHFAAIYGKKLEERMEDGIQAIDAAPAPHKRVERSRGWHVPILPFVLLQREFFGLFSFSPKGNLHFAQKPKTMTAAFNRKPNEN